MTTPLIRVRRRCAPIGEDGAILEAKEPLSELVMLAATAQLICDLLPLPVEGPDSPVHCLTDFLAMHVERAGMSSDQLLLLAENLALPLTTFHN